MYVISCPHATWLKADRYSHLKANGLWCHMWGSTCTYLYPVFTVSSHLHTSLCWIPLCSSHFAIVGVVTNSSSKFHLEFSLNDINVKFHYLDELAHSLISAVSAMLWMCHSQKLIPLLLHGHECPIHCVGWRESTKMEQNLRTTTSVPRRRWKRYNTRSPCM